MTDIQTHLAALQPNYPDNAKSILKVLLDAYNESSGFDNVARFVYLLSGKPAPNNKIEYFA